MQNLINSKLLNQSSGEKLLLTLWVGTIWAIGYIAAPTLFGTLEDRQLAGMLAGKMFTTVSYVGLFCGTVLLLSALKHNRELKTNVQFWIVFIMLLLVVAGEFILQPQMAQLKVTGLVEGSEAAAQFKQYHHISTVLYMLNSLLGLLLVMLHGHQSLPEKSV